MEVKFSLPLSEMPIFTAYSSDSVEVEVNFKICLNITSIVSRLKRLIMHLFIYDFTIQDLEGIQMDALVEREDGLADVGVVGQTEVFL